MGITSAQRRHAERSKRGRERARNRARGEGGAPNRPGENPTRSLEAPSLQISEKREPSVVFTLDPVQPRPFYAGPSQIAHDFFQLLAYQRAVDAVAAAVAAHR